VDLTGRPGRASYPLDTLEDLAQDARLATGMRVVDSRVTVAAFAEAISFLRTEGGDPPGRRRGFPATN
jgi:hypothetical protein